MFKTRLLLTEDQLQARIRELAAQLNHDYSEKTLDILCVLKGSLFFAADLIRQLKMPVHVHFLQVRSYDAGTKSSGTVHLQFTSEFELANRDVLVLEDILDTGITFEFLLKHLKQKKPRSLKTCVLLDKPGRRKVQAQVDYRGFEIENVFVIGYGLDYNELGRNLPYVAVFLDETTVEHK
jgi:hypoxanthine phosphoribosyltransferase